MPRNRSKAVPEGSGPVPHHDEYGSDHSTMADLYRMVKERFDRSYKQFDDLTEKMRVTNQRLAGLEHEARQPRLATKADVEPDTKTCKRTEDASAAERVKNSSARVDDGATSLTIFGMIAEPPAPEKCIDDVLVSRGTEAPKPDLPLMEVRILSSAAGGLLPASAASTTMRVIFPRPLFL